MQQIRVSSKYYCYGKLQISYKVALEILQNHTSNNLVPNLDLDSTNNVLATSFTLGTVLIRGLRAEIWGPSRPEFKS